MARKALGFLFVIIGMAVILGVGGYVLFTTAWKDLVWYCFIAVVGGTGLFFLFLGCAFLILMGMELILEGAEITFTTTDTPIPTTSPRPKKWYEFIFTSSGWKIRRTKVTEVAKDTPKKEKTQVHKFPWRCTHTVTPIVYVWGNYTLTQDESGKWTPRYNDQMLGSFDCSFDTWDQAEAAVASHTYRSAPAAEEKKVESTLHWTAMGDDHTDINEYVAGDYKVVSEGMVGSWTPYYQGKELEFETGSHFISADEAKGVCEAHAALANKNA